MMDITNVKAVARLKESIEWLRRSIGAEEGDESVLRLSGPVVDREQEGLFHISIEISKPVSVSVKDILSTTIQAEWQVMVSRQLIAELEELVDELQRAIDCLPVKHVSIPVSGEVKVGF